MCLIDIMQRFPNEETCFEFLEGVFGIKTAHIARIALVWTFHANMRTIGWDGGIVTIVIRRSG